MSVETAQGFIQDFRQERANEVFLKLRRGEDYMYIVVSVF